MLLRGLMICIIGTYCSSHCGGGERRERRLIFVVKLFYCSCGGLSVE
jgi:hypothetical protein